MSQIRDVNHRRFPGIIELSLDPPSCSATTSVQTVAPPAPCHSADLTTAKIYNLDTTEKKQLAYNCQIDQMLVTYSTV